jgi:hypothetical protein
MVLDVDEREGAPVSQCALTAAVRDAPALRGQHLIEDALAFQSGCLRLAIAQRAMAGCASARVACRTSRAQRGVHRVDLAVGPLA